MKFNVKVTFTGLCSLVPSKSWATLDKYSTVRVLFVDGGGFAGNVPFWDLVEPAIQLPRHVSLIRVEPRDIKDASVSLKQLSTGLIWYLSKTSVLSFAIDADASADVRNDLSASWDPNLAGVHVISDLNTLDLTSLTWLTPMEYVCGAADAPVEAAALRDSSHANLRARVELRKGSLAVEDLHNQRWNIDDDLSTITLYRPLANKVTLSLTDVSTFTIQAVVTPPSAPIRVENLDLQPQTAGETVEITIANACRDNPLDWTVPFTPVDDTDFRWHYHLLTPDAKMRIRHKLTSGKKIAYPRPLGVASNGGAAGGVNCFPNTPPPGP